MSPSLSFRPLKELDFGLLHLWLSQPHVYIWWQKSFGHEEVAAKYRPRIAHTEPTHVYIMEYDSRAIGWIQWYRWFDYPTHAAQLGAPPDSAGIDLAIGEETMLGRGIGPLAIRQFIEEFIFVDPAITAVISDPEENNLRSLRAFEKAGFKGDKNVRLRGENVQRRVVRLERAA